MSLLILTLIVFGIIQTGHCLQCFSCYAVRDFMVKDCGSYINCTNTSPGCLDVEIMDDNDGVTYVYKSCADENECNLSGTFRNMDFQNVRECQLCKTELCNGDKESLTTMAPIPTDHLPIQSQPTSSSPAQPTTTTTTPTTTTTTTTTEVSTFPSSVQPSRPTRPPRPVFPSSAAILLPSFFLIFLSQII